MSLKIGNYRFDKRKDGSVILTLPAVCVGGKEPGTCYVIFSDDDLEKLFRWRERELKKISPDEQK